MKTVFLQLTNHLLKLTPVTKSFGKYHYGIPVPFELPEELKGGSLTQNLFLFSDFSNQCIRKIHQKRARIVVCVDDGSVISKEFQHLPAKRANLLAAARLEAAAVLPAGAEEYLIETYPYQREPGSNGKLKSILYAVPEKLVKEIKRQFGRYGLKVVKMTPSIHGLVAAGRAALNSEGKPSRASLTPSDKTTAIVDLGFEKISLAMFLHGAPVFERSFDSVYDDIIDIACSVHGVSLTGAERQLRENGVFAAAGGRPGEEERVRLLLDSACGEVIRNIRVVLSSERLELDRIIFCGAFTSLPDFGDFLEHLGLDIPYAGLESSVNLSRYNIALEEKTAGGGFHAGDFFTLNGLLSEAGGVNFLDELAERRSAMTVTVTIMALVTLVMLAGMSLQPLVYGAALQRQQKDQAALADVRIEDAKALQRRQAEFEEQIQSAKTDQARLPYGKSKANITFDNIFYQVAPQITTIENCTVNNSTGQVTLTFTTDSFDDYIAVRRSVIDSGYFLVVVPFSAKMDEKTGSCACNAGLVVNGFEVFPPPETPQKADASSVPAETKGEVASE